MRKRRRKEEERKRKKRREEKNSGLEYLFGALGWNSCMEPICSEHLLCLELDISSLGVWNIAFVWNTCLDISKETIVRMLV